MNIKRIFMVLLLGFVFCNYYMSNINGRMMNEDIQQNLYGIESIYLSQDLKLYQDFSTDRYRDGPSFTFSNEEGTAVINKFPTMIFFYAMILAVPGLDFFFYINIFLGFFSLVSIYFIITRFLGKLPFNIFILFLIANGLFLSYATYFFESFIYTPFLLLGLYYYIRKSYFGIYFLCALALVRPENLPLIFFLVFIDLFRKNFFSGFMVIFILTIILMTNYQLTGYLNFLNAGQIRSGSDVTSTSEASILITTVYKYLFNDADFSVMFEHIKYLFTKTSYLAFFFVLSLGTVIHFARRKDNFFIFLIILFYIIIFTYGSRSFYYGFGAINFYSSFIRYCLGPLLLLLGAIFCFMKNHISNRFVFLLVFNLGMVYSYSVYLTGLPGLSYSLFGRLSVTQSHEKIVNLLDIIPPDALVVSDGTQDKFIFRNHKNIIQLELGSQTTSSDFISYVFQLNEYLNKPIYLIHSSKKSDLIGLFFGANNITPELLSTPVQYNFNIWKIR